MLHIISLSMRQPRPRLSATCAGVLLVAAFVLPGCSKSSHPPALHNQSLEYSTVSSSSVTVPGILDAHAMAVAEHHIGESGAFIGQVTGVYQPHPHATVIIDFDRNYRKALVASIEPWNQIKLPDPAKLVGKRVLITGTWVKHLGVTEIELTSPAQVTILTK